MREKPLCASVECLLDSTFGVFDSVRQNVLSKKAAPQMVASMGQFKLVGSYRTRRKLQYQKAVDESPNKSHGSLPP